MNSGAESAVAGVTFDEFAEQWKALKLLKLGTKLKQRQCTRVQIDRYLRKDLLSSLGHLPLDQISQREVLLVLRQIEARGALPITGYIRKCSAKIINIKEVCTLFSNGNKI